MSDIDIKDKGLYKIITDTMNSVKEEVDTERLIVDCADKLSLEVIVVKEVLEFNKKKSKNEKYGKI